MGKKVTHLALRVKCYLGETLCNTPNRVEWVLRQLPHRPWVEGRSTFRLILTLDPRKVTCKKCLKKGGIQ